MMKVVFNTLVLVVGLYLTGCSIFKPKVSEIITDTVYVQVNNEGEISYIEPLAALKAQKPYILSKDYDFITINANEKIKIIVDNIDFCSSTLKVEKFDDNNKIKISVLPITTEIVLENKCQVQKWYDPYVLPSISIKDKIVGGKKEKDQQIVITPIYNKNCERIGFQIRYGSIERGCAKEGKKVVEEFNKCNGYPRIKGKRKLKLIDVWGG